MVPFFSSGDHSFKARFKLAKCSDDSLRMRIPTTKSSKPFDYFGALFHDDVLQFLAPHEILALFRTNSTIWTAFTPSSRRFVLLRSVFDYLCISEECAQTVAGTVRGGWKTFGPLLVRMCEELAHNVYGHLEPDPAHRCFLAEQACFFNYGRHNNPGYSRGRLAGRQMALEGSVTVSPGGDEAEDDEGMPVSLEPDSEFEDEEMQLADLPNWEDLHDDIEVEGVYWGGMRTVRNMWEHDGYDPGVHLTWMMDHSVNVKSNIHYKQRLDAGLYPVIPVFRFSDGVECVWMLRVGPDLEQIFCATDYDSDTPVLESFPGLTGGIEDFLVDGHNWDTTITNDGSGGMVDLLLGSNYLIDDDIPLVCMAIWCMRHALEPFNDSSIDWDRLIKERVVDENERLLLRDALVNPFFGKADIQNYRE